MHACCIIVSMFSPCVYWSSKEFLGQARRFEEVERVLRDKLCYINVPELKNLIWSKATKIFFKWFLLQCTDDCSLGFMTDIVTKQRQCCKIFTDISQVQSH